MKTDNSVEEIEALVYDAPQVYGPRLAYTISEAAAMAGISLALFKHLAADGRIPLRYVNSKPIVVAAEWHRWIALRSMAPHTHWAAQESPIPPSALNAAHRGHMNTKSRSTPPMIDAFGPTEIYSPPLAYTVGGAAAAVGIGQTLLREQILRGLLEARYVNSKPIVRAEALKEWLVSLPSSTDKP